MWIPKTEDEIIEATSTNSLEETVIFDAKKEVPAKNIETAKDVSALANTSGGVLLYGVDEDSNGRPSLLTPITLVGQRERIESIVRTSVDEVPSFKVSAIPKKTDPAIGYIVVLVPPSERAPHMVVVKGERRFYGRGETGNYILSQAEVARLYERRQQVNTSQIDEFLQQFLDDPPIPRNGDYAHMYIVAKPVLHDDTVLYRAREAEQTTEDLLSHMIGKTREIYERGYSPDFAQPPHGWKRYPEGFLGKMVTASEIDRRPDAHTLQILVNLDGSASLFCGRCSDFTQGQKFFIASVVEGNTAKFFGFVGELLVRASYFSMVDIALVITDLQNSVPYETRSRFFSLPKYDGPDYRKTVRVSSLVLTEQPKEIASQILTPVFDAVSRNTIRPFEARE